jgi:hypothetical protein
MTPDPAAMKLPQRLLWSVDRALRTRRAPRARRIPLGIRLAYVLVAVLGLLLAGASVMEKYRPWGSGNQLICGLLLAVLGVLAACGLFRFDPLRNACTGIGFWLSVSPCVLPRPLTCLDLLLGLAAFLVSGAAGEAVVARNLDGPVQDQPDSFNQQRGSTDGETDE